MTQNRKRIIGLILGALVPIILSQISVSAPLSQKSMIAIGLLLGAVIWILFETLAEYQAMLVMCILFVFTKVVPINVAFGTFSTGTWWIMVGAIGIGVAATESGFIKRLALIMLNAFPATFRGQCLAFMFSGAIISPLLPSTTAKGAIGASLARSTTELFGFKMHSQGAVGLFMAFFTGYVSLNFLFLNGAAVTYSVAATIPQTYGINWITWFLYALPWGIISTVLMALGIFKFYEPKNTQSLSKAYVRDALKELGPWRQNEKIAFAIILTCLILWMTESWSGLNSAMVASAGFVLMFALKVCTPDKIRNMAWESLLFVGCFLCLPTIFSQLGINKWIALTLGGAFEPLMTNMYLLVFVITIVVYLTRFLLVSLGATAILVTTLMLPFCAAYNVHPFVIAFVAYTSTNTWNVSYQNTVTIAALAATENKWVSQKDILFGSGLYMVTNTIACMLCVPIWKMMGLC